MDEIEFGPRPGLDEKRMMRRRECSVSGCSSPRRNHVYEPDRSEAPHEPHRNVAGADEPTQRVLEAIRERDVTDAVVRVRYRVREEQVAQVDPEQFRKALAAADTVAGIERTVDPAERKRRTAVTRESGLEEAVRQYVGQHDELSGMEDDLVEAALALDAELDADKTNPGDGRA